MAGAKHPTPEQERLKVQVVEAETVKADQEKVILAQQEHTQAVEKNLRSYKEQYAKNAESFRTRMGLLNSEKSAAAAEKQQLVAKASTLEAEIRALQESKASSEAEKAITSQTSSMEALSQASNIAALCAERDALLAEKSTWAVSSSVVPATADIEEAKRLWDAEKAELIQARDAAQAEMKNAEKRSSDAKISYDKLANRARELLKAQQKATEQQEAAVAAAVAKVKSEMQDPIAATPSDDLVKKHADELQALQETLTAKHAAELKAAVEAARAENPGSDSPVDQDAKIAAAIAEHDKGLEKIHTEEIAAAVERGRIEGGAKAKLKDAQLVRTQKKVKDLEAQILAWQKEGLVPTASTPSASTSAAPASAPALAASTSVPALDSTLPAKPATAARGGTPTAVRGGAPNVPRGAAATRGATTRGGRAGALSIRGGAARVPPVAPTTATNPTAGVSIMGAAKRPREEGTPTEDSLAKRLKPAEPGKPVQLRRLPPS
ncbi:hypothetical protein B0H10DRAFT_944077 [Mycena sp. CBHHK59/15]|nr:hypothetical protein B0H10DRAFT_944077 [Mycena sp. CBHHK59/15]